MKELIFYRCSICGNLICMINDSGVTPTCCGTEMEAVTANTADAAAEKHVPCISRDGNKVMIAVGDLPHPMTQEHFIEWVILQTNRGTYSRRLHPENIPEVCFRIRSTECPVRVYAWCNLHGLWLRELNG